MYQSLMPNQIAFGIKLNISKLTNSSEFPSFYYKEITIWAVLINLCQGSPLVLAVSDGSDFEDFE